MTTRVGINGFGRIGRAFTRLALDRPDLEVVAVNDITDARTLAHLLEFDSTYGRLGDAVKYGNGTLSVGGRTIRVLSDPDPARLDWAGLSADIVIESTGKFRTREAAGLHLKGGARKVLVSAPGKGVDVTVVLGVNDQAYDPLRHDVISNASCTTNCVVIGDTASCVFDPQLTQSSGTLVTVFGWYDNEWGYASRLADLAVLAGTR